MKEKNLVSLVENDYLIKRKQKSLKILGFLSKLSDFYKFKKIEAGPFNSALITDQGEVLLQGLNDFGQLGLSKEINSMVPFFPNFVKLDFFVSNKLKVDDVAISAATYSFLAENRLFTMGRGDLG